MKSKGNSRSASFNVRPLIAPVIVMIGGGLVLAASSPFGTRQSTSGPTTQRKAHVITQSKDPLIPVPFDCSRVYELGIDRMENFAAQRTMIDCGFAKGGSASLGGRFSALIQTLLPAPLAYGAPDIDLITGTETSPHVTQSETFS